MNPLLLIYREHCESIGQESTPLGRSWQHLTMTPLAFVVLVLLLAGCASNLQQQQHHHSSDTPFFDTPDVDSLH
jgi:hypothetical protein